VLKIALYSWAAYYNTATSMERNSEMTMFIELDYDIIKHVFKNLTIHKIIIQNRDDSSDKQNGREKSDYCGETRHKR
jgi:hypothetical protein